MTIAGFILAAVIGYLLGSIPSGLIVSRIQSKTDIRNYGSGRTGGTNVLRTLGRRAFIIVAAADLAKAALAVALAWLIVGDGHLDFGSYHAGRAAAQALAGICAILGHIFPLFARFKGGRGVATFVGGLAVLSLVAALVSAGILIIFALISGFVSLGSLLGVLGACVVMLLLIIGCDLPPEYMVYVIVGALIIIIAHRDNIKRLLTGKERKFYRRTTSTSDPS